MEVKKVEVRKGSVSMTFIPQGYDDIVMAEVILSLSLMRRAVLPRRKSRVCLPLKQSSSIMKKEVSS